MSEVGKMESCEHGQLAQKCPVCSESWASPEPKGEEMEEHEDAATGWYAGMTQKHYELALGRAVAAERERCIRSCRFAVYGRVGSATMRQVAE